MSKILISIFIDGKAFKNKKLSIDSNLAYVREKLSLSQDIFFLNKNEQKISIDLEESTILSTILKDKILYLSKKNQNQMISLFDIYKGKDKIVSFYLPLETSLSELRKKFLTNNKDSLFLLNGMEIEKDEEEETSIKEIISGNTIYITEDKNERNIKEFTFHIGIKVIIKRLDKNLKLKKVRKILQEENKIGKDAKFIKNHLAIENEQESELNIDSLVNDRGYVVIKDFIKSIPIEGSKYLNKIIANKKYYLYPSQKFSEDEEIKCKTIMFIGETGSGKTTLLNSLVNFLTGIQYEDKFRYIIINEEDQKDNAVSHTTNVNIYYIKSHNNYPPIKIIDTPGFGDTRGIDYDQKIPKKIEKVFKKNNISINAICFLGKSSNSRLTFEQEYISESITKMFGKDIVNNFLILLTFCDCGKPVVLDSFRKDENFSKLIHEANKKWYLEFNNSGIFPDETQNNEVTYNYWKIAMSSFKEFINTVCRLPYNNLTLTKKVLEERHRIEELVKNLEPQLDEGLFKMNKLKKTYSSLKRAEKEIEDAKDFITYNTEIKKVKVPREQNYTTYCYNCDNTCHDNCLFDNDVKYKCAYFEPSDDSEIEKKRCVACEGKCPVSCHYNANFIIKRVPVKVPTTKENLKKDYCKAKSNKSDYEQILFGLSKDFRAIERKCLILQEEIKSKVEKLKSIALNVNAYESSEKYIERLIKHEESKNEFGSDIRIKGYKSLLKRHKLILQSFNSQKNTGIKDFEEYKNKYLNEDLNRTLKYNEELSISGEFEDLPDKLNINLSGIEIEYIDNNNIGDDFIDFLKD